MREKKTVAGSWKHMNYSQFKPGKGTEEAGNDQKLKLLGPGRGSRWQRWQREQPHRALNQTGRGRKASWLHE